MKPNARSRAILALQLAFILLVFGLDFGHGILLGEYNIAFQPIYRLRQSLAIAISRMHAPSAQGYLAYQSVVNSFNENGFAIFSSDQGPHLDGEELGSFLTDTARIDRALQQARDASINSNLQPELIRGNELGYADYSYLAFCIFGTHIASFYYFYFLLLGLACSLFLMEYRNSPFLMFLLAVYLAGLFFLQNYAQSAGHQLSSLANSRMFDALSLLPAMHVLVATWRKTPPRLPTLVTVSGQAVILAFLVSTRTAVSWQVAMIVVASLVVMLTALSAKRRPWRVRKVKLLTAAWPCTLTLLFLVAHSAAIRMNADARYDEETGFHMLWHGVLSNILESNSKLQLLYVGNNEKYAEDEIAYDALVKDLNDRHDVSSPAAIIEGNGHITIDLARRSNRAFDQLARSLSLRIIFEHPLQVLSTLPKKASQQVSAYAQYGALRCKNLLGAAILAMLAGLIWLIGGSRGIKERDLASVAAVVAIVLGCSLIPPLIAPSGFSVGTLLSFLIAAFLGLLALAITAVRMANAVLTSLVGQPKSGARTSVPH
jgi:hypothetical protein